MNPVRSPPFTPPPTIFGDYLLLHRAGFGGMAEVYRAQRRNRKPGDPDLALKRLLPHIAEDPTLARLYLREVEALRRIDHPVVVRLIDSGEVHGVPFVVMPWLGGLSLRQVLAGSDPDRPVPLEVGQALDLAAQVAEGLHAAHLMGVVHRDVSPSNILVTEDGEARLIDFGIARVAGLAQTTHGQGLRGKWAYATPEQIAGQPLDGRTDLFALGSVAVECILGRAPFAQDDREATLARIQSAEIARWPQFRPEFAQADPILRTMLAHDLEARLPDGQAVADALRQVLNNAAELHGGTSELQTNLAHRVRRGLKEWVSTEIMPAELRGEDVTRPETDADATEVRMA